MHPQFDRGASPGARGVLDEKKSGSSGPDRRKRTDGGRNMKSLDQMRPDRTKHAAKQGRRDQPSGSRMLARTQKTSRAGRSEIA